MKNHIILIILTLICFDQCVGQTSISAFDHSKYWYYRWRLTHIFLKKGEVDLNCQEPTREGISTGFSIPADQIFATDKDINGHKFSAKEILDGKGKHHWGDGTSYLGIYIGVLATEYKLLKNDGQPTNKVEEELYYAMKAFERLDKNSGILYFPYKDPKYCIEDGFFVRDDVSKKFVSTYFPSSLLLNNTTDNPFASEYLDNNIYSDGSKIGQLKDINDFKEGNPFPSTDQIADLYIGFALIVKCLDGNVNYNGFNFVQKAKDYTRRTVEWIKKNNYTIVNPSTGQHVAKFGETEVQTISYALAQSASRIVNGNWGDDLFEDHEFESPITFAASKLWESVQNPVSDVNLMLFASGPRTYVRALVHNFGSTGHSWKIGFVPQYLFGKFEVHTWFFNLYFGGFCEYDLPTGGENILPIPIGIVPCDGAPTIAINTTAFTLSRQGEEFHTELYSLMHQYLFNSNNPFIRKEKYRQAIHSAPCEGPHHLPGKGKDGVDGWKADMKWERGFKKSNGIDQGEGAWNGLDYMLLYNLYALVEHSELGVGVFENELFRTFQNNTFTQSKRYYGFEDIDFSGTNYVNNGTELKFISPEINISGQMDIPIGSNVSFEVPKNGVELDCSSDGLSYERKASVNVKSTKKNIASAKIQTNATNLEIKFDSLSYYKDYNNYLNQQIHKVVNWDSIQIAMNNRKYVPISLYQASRESLVSSKKTSININSDLDNELNQTKVYPNPFDNFITIEVNLKNNETISLFIINIFGQQIKEVFINKFFTKGKNKMEIDLSEIPIGTYFYKLETNSFVDYQKLYKIK